MIAEIFAKILDQQPLNDDERAEILNWFQQAESSPTLLQTMFKGTSSISKLSQITGQLGEVTRGQFLSGDDGDPLDTTGNNTFTGVGMASPGLEINGDEASIFGMNAGKPTFWLSALTGQGTFAGGKATLNDEGIKISDLGDAITFERTSALAYGSGNRPWIAVIKGNSTSGSDAQVEITTARLVDLVNLATNGTFETGDFTGFTETDADNSVTISTDAYAGTYSVDFSNTGSSTTRNLNLTGLPSNYYFIRLWAKSSSESCTFIVQGATSLRAALSGDGLWHQYTFVLDVPTTNIKFYSTSGAVSVLVDNIEVYEAYDTGRFVFDGDFTANGVLNSDFSSADTSSVTSLLYLKNSSTGTPASGFGTQMTFQATNSISTLKNVLALIGKYTDATFGSETSLVTMQQLALGSDRESVLPAAGWQAYVYPRAHDFSAPYSGSLVLAANGGSVAIPMDVVAPILLESVSVLNNNGAGDRTWGWDLYVQDTNTESSAENTLRRVAASSANETFTSVAAASLRTITASGEPVYIPPGAYWLVIQCRHATNTFAFGITTSGSAFHVNTAQTKTTTNPNGATLDFVAATWTKVKHMYAARLNCQVFGQTTAFS